MSENLPALPESVQHLPVLTQDLGQIKSMLAKNMGAANLTAADLDKIKVPSGDIPLWMVQTLEGPKGLEALEGVIAMVSMGRGYWQSDEVGNTPPDCSSENTIVGYGRRGALDTHDGPHDCASCIMNQFGTATKDGKAGAGKACNERAHLFLLTGQGYLPQVVQVPATSLGGWRKFIARLSSFGKPFSAVVVKMTLAPKKNKGGTSYMEIVFNSISVLPPEACSRVEAYAAAFAESFKRATRQEYDAAPGSGGDADDAPPPPSFDIPESPAAEE